MKNLELAQKVIDECVRLNVNIVTVESCTGGGLVHTLTNIPGASQVITRSFVTYSNPAKIELGVPAEILDQYTVYSIETAHAMAEAGLRISPESQLAVGITGSLTREDPANPNSEPGVVYVATHYMDQKTGQTYRITESDRVKGKEVIIGYSLQQILKELE